MPSVRRTEPFVCEAGDQTTIHLSRDLHCLELYSDEHSSSRIPERSSSVGGAVSLPVSNVSRLAKCETMKMNLAIPSARLSRRNGRCTADGSFLHQVTLLPASPFRNVVGPYVTLTPQKARSLVWLSELCESSSEIVAVHCKRRRKEGRVRHDGGEERTGANVFDSSRLPPPPALLLRGESLRGMLKS